MYLQKIRLENIKCFEQVEINLTQSRNKPPRLMTVILGDNGVGKTTLLQAMAIALGGERVANLVKKPETWARVAHKQGGFYASITRGEAEKNYTPKRTLQISYLVTGDEPMEVSKKFYDRFTIAALRGQDGETLQRTAYAEGQLDWLACGYGPLRRFSGQRLWPNNEIKSSRFASLFGENEGLIAVEDWLLELDRRALTADNDTQRSYNRRLFNQLGQMLIQILPQEDSDIPRNIHPDHLSSFVKTMPEGLFWRDSLGNWVKFSQLSDGYQSVMAWTGDLVSRLLMAFPYTDNLLEQEGVVLIDEIDIHLHPTWQRTILNQLRQTFPKIQFIVTTHSPLVAANAKEGELFVLKREDQRVVIEPTSSVQGWRSDQILTSDLFGLETTRDPETERYLARYDELLALRVGEKWNTNLTQELAQLENILRQKLPPPGETLEQRQLQQKMEDFITQTLKPGKSE